MFVYYTLLCFALHCFALLCIALLCLALLCVPIALLCFANCLALPSHVMVFVGLGDGEREKVSHVTVSVGSGDGERCHM